MDSERQIRIKVVTHWNEILNKIAQVFLFRSFKILNGLVVFMTRELLHQKAIPPSVFLEKGFKNDKT